MWLFLRKIYRFGVFTPSFDSKREPNYHYDPAERYICISNTYMAHMELLVISVFTIQDSGFSVFCS